MNLSASTYQKEFLPGGATEVHAVVRVTAYDAGGGTGPTTTSPDKAAGLIVDPAAPWASPGTRLCAARQSVAASVEEPPDGTWFAVIAGNHEAFWVYPPAFATGEPPSLIRAETMSRAEAVNVARQLQPEGATAIGTSLDLARDVFVRHPEAIKLAYLLPDRRNESEPHENLEAALRQCTDVFHCGARGVGSDLNVAELRLDDAATGTVRLKQGVAATDEMALDTRSTRPVRVTAKPPDPSTPPPTPPAPPTGA